MHSFNVADFNEEITTWYDAADCLWRGIIISLVIFHFSPEPGKIFSVYHPMFWRSVSAKRTNEQTDGAAPFNHATREEVQAAVVSVVTQAIALEMYEILYARRSYVQVELTTQVRQSAFISEAKRQRQRGYERRKKKYPWE